MHGLLRPILATCIAIAALLLLADLVWFFHGSLEMFPTDGQEDEVRLATGAIALALVLIETGLVYLFVTLSRRGHKR